MSGLEKLDKSLKSMKWYDRIPIAGTLALLLAVGSFSLSRYTAREEVEGEPRTGARIIRVYSPGLSCKAEDFNKNGTFEDNEIDMYGVLPTPPIESCREIIRKNEKRISGLVRLYPDGYEITIKRNY